MIGYAQVSATDQNLGRQMKALKDCYRIFADKLSGKNTERVRLQEMLRHVREGNTLRVTSPDRLTRSTRHLLAIVEELNARGVAAQFLDNPALNTDTPRGRFMLTILGAVAQLERSVIRERQMEDIALAGAAGTYDKCVRLTAEQIAEARELRISRQTLYTALSGAGSYAEVVS